MEKMICQVWKTNLEEEYENTKKVRAHCPYIAVDTEFPGFLRNTPRCASESQRYSDLKYNVDSMKIIQLEKNGIDLEKCSIDSEIFSRLLQKILGMRGLRVRLVTFHGFYDLGYLIKLLTKRDSPNSLPEFLRILGTVSGVYDIKHIAKFCPGLMGGEIGLTRLSKILKVERIGDSHQAGSDSLLTSALYTKMKQEFLFQESVFVGALYGIDSRIWGRPRPVFVSMDFYARCYQPIPQQLDHMCYQPIPQLNHMFIQYFCLSRNVYQDQFNKEAGCM
ncbi:putative CCR4-associated factor 1 homolog 6 [Tasmannia lanceolata]|uniref:putative CCR4-associated factor 1 homolog 6 n=1 Tax=Tasmannia lanceolata TaxID=3420 RepID=UPI004063121B